MSAYDFDERTEPPLGTLRAVRDRHGLASLDEARRLMGLPVGEARLVPLREVEERGFFRYDGKIWQKRLRQRDDLDPDRRPTGAPVANALPVRDDHGLLENASDELLPPHTLVEPVLTRLTGASRSRRRTG